MTWISLPKLFGLFLCSLSLEGTRRAVHEKSMDKMVVQWLKQGVDVVTINSELGLLAEYVKQSRKLETLVRES